MVEISRFSRQKHHKVSMKKTLGTTRDKAIHLQGGFPLIEFHFL